MSAVPAVGASSLLVDDRRRIGPARFAARLADISDQTELGAQLVAAGGGAAAPSASMERGPLRV